MSTIVTVLISIGALIGAMAVFIFMLMLLDHWQMRRAWRQADEVAREYMRRHRKCPHGFPTPEACPTCYHFNKIREFERNAA
jgi:cytochrome oxidase assembly protein ShyY1